MNPPEVLGFVPLSLLGVLSGHEKFPFAVEHRGGEGEGKGGQALGGHGRPPGGRPGCVGLMEGLVVQALW